MTLPLLKIAPTAAHLLCHPLESASKRKSRLPRRRNSKNDFNHILMLKFSDQSCYLPRSPLYFFHRKVFVAISEIYIIHKTWTRIDSWLGTESKFASSTCGAHWDLAQYFPISTSLSQFDFCSSLSLVVHL